MQSGELIRVISCLMMVISDFSVSDASHSFTHKATVYERLFRMLLSRAFLIFLWQCILQVSLAGTIRPVKSLYA